MRKFITQFVRFGLVGGIGLVVDLGVFNLLRATIFNPDHIHEGPVFAKIVSTVLAIIVNWIGNRHWTFREHRGPQLVREGIEFGVVSIGGMLIGLFCLFISHYVLGFTSVSRWARPFVSRSTGSGCSHRVAASRSRRFSRRCTNCMKRAGPRTSATTPRGRLVVRPRPLLT
jgi:putative flippase GtrA